ncbi:hypothetical protein [Endozoicomonas sp. 4G]|uniref:hypothetical protein n=1 Tax=Endozoicomonas sp. 4G TaxID=2872754 RepID=UPI0020786F6B|nr:hypothetical protein [Endozoicomonas sp. 4G]
MFECLQTLDTSADIRQRGPSLNFTNNTITGSNFQQGGSSHIPEQGVLVDIPNITKKTSNLSVTGNTFQGKMSSAGQFFLGYGTNLEAFNNTINIDNSGRVSTGNYRPIRRGGFTLSGGDDSSKDRPLFKVANNDVKVRNHAITVLGLTSLDLACNTLSGFTPWLQPQSQYSLKAIEPSQLRAQCRRSLKNTWRARSSNPSATACDGLVNVESRFTFNAGVCPAPYVSTTSLPASTTTSSSASTTTSSSASTTTSSSASASSVSSSTASSTTHSTVVTTTSTPQPVLCDDLLTGHHSRGVQQRLKQDKDLMAGRQCVVLSADPAKDLSEWIKQIPENTIVLFSSNIASGVAPSPTANPVTAKTPIEYFTDHEILLKNGQGLIGAADEGFEIVIRDRPAFKPRYLIRLGATDNFQSGDIKDSHIKHITFRSAPNDQRNPVDSIVYAECYNRKLIVEKNLFYAPVRAAVVVDCKASLDASADQSSQGPNLQFAHNKIIGKKYNPILDKGSSYIPNQGIFIHLPAIMNQSGQLAVFDNTFEGYMAQAGEFRLAAGTHIKIFKNRIDISNVGSTTRTHKGGIVLSGHTDTVKNLPVKSLPVFYLAGNQIHVTQTAITVKGKLELSLACNQLRAVTPWRQPQEQSNLKALLMMPKEVTATCKEVQRSVARTTPSSPAGNRFANTWTAINNSSDTACSGLVNFEGQFFFETEVCRPVTVPSETENLPTSSTGTTAVTTALGIIITLSILLAL